MKLFPLLLALWLQAPAPAPAQQAPSTQSAPIIESVLIRGNKRVKSDTVKYSILSKAGDPLNPQLVARDVRAVFAAQQAFDDVSVITEEGNNGRVILIFEVKEKPSIRRIDYKGLTSVQVSDVMKALSEKKAMISQADLYDQTKISKAIQVIKGLLAEKGKQKASVEVEAQDVPPNAVVITFVVTEGPRIKIEAINFEGNKVFTDGALKKAMKL
jgi:outer membrane protein insertion porin family